MRPSFFFFALIGLLGLLLHGASHAQPLPQRLEAKEVGLVLLHGKWGMPPAPLAIRFSQLGFQVESPEMGWSRGNAYRVAYAHSLEAVHAAVVALRAKGAKKVVLGGPSFGANGALAYASQYDDIDGLILFAPGHNPDIDKNRNPSKVAEARALVVDGRGSQSVTVTDHNDGGRSEEITLAATSYLSYFDPEGLAAMPRSARNLKKPLPVIVFMGKSDFVTRQGPRYFFERLPAHPGSRYQVSPADHRAVPAASFEETLAWLEAVILR